MNYEQMKEALRKEREHIAAESRTKIEAINQAINALTALNGQPEPQHIPVTVGKPVKKGPKVWIRKREHSGEILKRVGLHYTDLAIEAARKAGRPVTTAEVFKYLQDLAGKRLNRKKYVSTLTVVLRQYAKKGKLLQTKVPNSKLSLWNAPNAAALQAGQEMLSIDLK